MAPTLIFLGLCLLPFVGLWAHRKRVIARRNIEAMWAALDQIPGIPRNYRSKR